MAKETYNQYGLRPLYPDQARIGYYKVAATQSIKIGDPLVLTAGQAAIAVAASSTILLGVAAQNSTLAAANTLIAVYDDPDTVFRGRASADASAVQAGYLPDLVGTTGAFNVNVEASAQDVFIFLGCLPEENSSAAGAYCKVKIRLHINGTARA